MAIDPDVFAPGFPDRMQDLMDACRNSQKVKFPHKIIIRNFNKKLTYLI